MSKVINVLEQLGQNASLQTPENIETYLTSTEISNNLIAAIVNNDIASLEHSLNVRQNIVCAIYTPDEDEPSEDDSEEKEEIRAAINL